MRRSSGNCRGRSCRRSTACAAASRPVPFVEDIVVPPASLPDFLRRLQEVLKDQRGHGDASSGTPARGSCTCGPTRSRADPGERARLERLAESIYAEVVALGGTIGGEQGLGLSRTRVFRAASSRSSAACSPR